MDHQRSRLYRWEDTHIAPRDLTPVQPDALTAIVRHVWQGEGLSFPPHVEIGRETVRVVATATREKIKFHRGQVILTHIVLHELAHAMTPIDALHGPRFVGVYMRLLNRYLGIDYPFMQYTAALENVEFDLLAQNYTFDL